MKADGGDDGIAEPEEGGDAPCWAHLFGDDPRPAFAAGEVAGSAPSDEAERPPNQPGGDVVDGGGE